MKNNKSEGVLAIVCGSSRNGKTEYVKRQLESFSRVIVWDIDEEYNGFVRVRTIAELINIVKKAGLKDIKIAFSPRSLLSFDAFCKIVLKWSDDLLENDKAGIAVVVEETADVTSPSKAPANFRVLIGRGMKRGISLFCVTQRPSESDKTSLGNAKVLVTFYMSRAADREYMSKEIGCNSDDIEALEKLQYLKKDVDSRKIVRGLIEF